MGHLIPEMGLNMAKHPDFPPDTKKSETPLVALSFPNQEDTNNTPNLQVIFIVRIKMAGIRVVSLFGWNTRSSWGHGSSSRAWPPAHAPLPRPWPGRGSTRCSQSSSHTWATRCSIARPWPPQALLLGSVRAETQSCSPKSPLEGSLGRVIC